MAEAERPVPPYDKRNLQANLYYCLFCRHSTGLEAHVVSHVRNQHGYETDYALSNGVHYTNGTHLKILIQRWETWSLEAVNKFHGQLDSLRGADDFELEVGVGLPEYGDTDDG